MIVVGDVTDKGVPAALVMASTHALLRSNAVRLLAPGQLLATVNDLLCDDIPAHMFVTCLVLVLDPATGDVVFANAGHNLPYLRTADGVVELRATGMPLGLMPGMKYDENTAVLQPGECLLLHSDGLAEAHNADREMFGFPRLADIVSRPQSGEQLIDSCMAELAGFTEADTEQEDDITLVTLERLASAVYADATTYDSGPAVASADDCLLAQFAVASVAVTAAFGFRNFVNYERGLRELLRVLKPGGRLAIADMVATATLPDEIKADWTAYTGCMAGASQISELEQMLREAGFEKIKIAPKDESRSFIREWLPGKRIEDYLVSATIEALKLMHH